MTRIKAPWTEMQVAALNRYQREGRFHPFTCGGTRGDKDHVDYAAMGGETPGLLIATRDGWVCPVCRYEQDWAHAFMAGGEQVASLPEESLFDRAFRRLKGTLGLPGPV